MINTVNIEIDGKNLTAYENTTILNAAKDAGIIIPSLCASKELLPYGACRLCAVEMIGKKGYVYACSVYASNGMKIKTYSNKLFSLKRTLMELYLSDHPNDCLTCSKNLICDLQNWAAYFGLRSIRYRGKSHLLAAADESNPYFRFDPSRCIVCARCVRACREVQGNFALTVIKRGFDSVIKAGDNFLNSECVSCGACVKTCPTGALIEKTVVNHGKAGSAATTTCGYCGVGCSFNVEYKGNNIVRMMPNDKSLSNYGHSCVKGRFAWGYVQSGDRLKTPLLRNSLNEPFKEVSWEEAVFFAAKKFKEIQSKYGVKAVGGISSSRCTNEENYLMQKLIRTGFGNNNIDTCARVCHQPTGYALGVAFGAGAGTQDLGSLFDADCIMIIGANPTEAHPVVGSFIRKTARNGADLIVIDPRETEVAKSPHISAKYHLRPLPGTNVSLLNALAYIIIKEGLLNADFIKERCDIESFNLYEEFILNDSNSPEAAEAITGVYREDIVGAARLYAKAKNASIFYGLGVTEHLQGSTGVLAIADLAMLTGNIGRKGVGVSPLRGQNNVQGAADMGAEPSVFPGYRHVSDDNVRLLFEKEWNRKLDPEQGIRLPDMLRDALAGRFKGLYILGEDIVQTDPDANRIIASLKSMEFVAVHDIFMNATADYAHVILPGSSFLEKDGTFTNWERRIQRVRKILEPVAGKPDWEILIDLSNALGYKMNYSNPSEIMEEIAKLTPSFSGVNYDKLSRLGSLQWPCTEDNPFGTEILHKDKFIRGKGRFIITSYIGSKNSVSKKYPYILTTVRNLFQYNCSNNTRRTENSVWYNKDILEISREDAKDLNINDGDTALIESRKGKVTLTAKISGRVKQGVVATTFHFPEYKTNVLTSDYSDWSTETPEYKVTAVSVKKYGDNKLYASDGYNADEPLQCLSNDKNKTAYGGEIIRMFYNLVLIFAPYPEDSAINEITGHIKKYWERRLIEKLIYISENENCFNEEAVQSIVYEGSISKNKEMPPKLLHKLAMAAIKALKVI